MFSPDSKRAGGIRGKFFDPLSTRWREKEARSATVDALAAKRDYREQEGRILSITIKKRRPCITNCNKKGEKRGGVRGKESSRYGFRRGTFPKFTPKEKENETGNTRKPSESVETVPGPERGPHQGGAATNSKGIKGGRYSSLH